MRERSKYHDGLVPNADRRRPQRPGLTGTAAFSHLPRITRTIKRALPRVALDIHTDLLTPAQCNGLRRGFLDLGALRPPAVGDDIEMTVVESETQAVDNCVVATLMALSESLRRTLTWDQGKEVALHRQITELTGTQVFFCDPHYPWQRGSNENMNGLLRDYFPKGTDLSGVATGELRRIAAEINTRPRKPLGWTTPADLMAAEKELATA